jgi:hypothetical protein
VTSATVTYLVVAAFVIYAVRIIVAAVRNAPERNDDTATCPPVDLDTELRRLLDDRADWPDAS